MNAFVLGSDGSIWNNFFNGAWNTWVHTGNPGDPGHPPNIAITSAPAAISRDIVRKNIDVFATGSDNGIWRLCTADGANWNQWKHIGNQSDPGHPRDVIITSAPSVTSWNSTDLHVFARGPDNSIWYNSFHVTDPNKCDGTWSGWKPINQSSSDVKPIYLLNLGYDTGNRNTGWEWGKLQVPQAHPDRFTSINKNDIQPPSPDPNGTNASKVTLKHGDVYTDPGGAQSNRAEVVLINKLPDRTNDPPATGYLFRENDDVWFHWYTLFSTNGYPTTSDTKMWQVWTQWHQNSDSTALCCTPAVEFNVLGSNLDLRVLGHIWDHQGCFNITAGQCGYKWVEHIQKGKWYDMLLHVKWSTSNNGGFMEMYVNHMRVSQNIMDKSHPFATLDSDGLVYLKQGLYRNPNIAFDQTIHHDGMQVVKCPPDHGYYHPDTQRCYTNPPYS